ncbi:hypothetical protein G4H71_16370 [Rhodococcus triatomae]|uniref:Uncharacterized protein n=1 Tax=Rhodococcus triatomae TaxID=300028 RepID=A0A1G8JM79_9NOCA|nr:hypothetical protein [Rhodococcus triatomae]QNG19688.1 hypothetical protein G4H72_14005 [Rhodococcus triatomae]QNG24397.1 hypothetical protein G4H71_16370 [Rhodococcus triatomae]SDI32107.1 hypothetical protein SAMN05444695_106224 [Rhodococcus triatomae]
MRAFRTKLDTDVVRAELAARAEHAHLRFRVALDSLLAACGWYVLADIGPRRLVLAFEDAAVLEREEGQFRTYSDYETAAQGALAEARAAVTDIPDALEDSSLEGLALLADRVSHTVTGFVAPRLDRRAAACRVVTVSQAHSLVDRVQRPYLGALDIAATARHLDGDPEQVIRPMGALAARWEAFPDSRHACATDIVDCADDYLARTWAVPS